MSKFPSSYKKGTAGQYNLDNLWICLDTRAISFTLKSFDWLLSLQHWLPPSIWLILDGPYVNHRPLPVPLAPSERISRELRKGIRSSQRLAWPRPRRCAGCLLAARVFQQTLQCILSKSSTKICQNEKHKQKHQAANKRFEQTWAPSSFDPTSSDFSRGHGALQAPVVIGNSLCQVGSTSSHWLWFVSKNL